MHCKASFHFGFFVGLGLFLAGALRENIVYFKMPHEILQMQEIPKKLRLGGLVVSQSVKSSYKDHQFDVTDHEKTIHVEYKGRLPDLFREKQGVVAVGTYDKTTKVFIAKQLLVKHDEYYRPDLHSQQLQSSKNSRNNMF